MIPAKNTLGKPDVVEPVPIKPKLGSVNWASVELFNAPKATLVTAPSEPDVPMNEPADITVDSSTPAVDGAALNMVRA